MADSVLMQKIDDQFGNGWHTNIIDIFPVKIIADWIGDSWYK